MGKGKKNGWSRVAFGDVVRQVKDRVDVEKCILDEYIRGEHFRPGELRLIGRSIIGDGLHGSAFNMRFRKGDVLYVSRNPHLRKVAIADFDGICANTTYVCRTNDNMLLQSLLPFIMQSERFVEHTINHKRGSTNFYLNWSDLANYEFDLPPLEEQNRIVEMLTRCENLLSRLEDLKVCSKLVLEVEREKFFNNSKLKKQNLGSLSKIRYGLGQPPTKKPDGVPMIRATNIYRGKIFHDNLIHVNAEEILDSREAFLKRGEILIVRSGAYTGDSALISEQWEGAVAGYDLVISPQSGKLHPYYLAQFLLSKRTLKTEIRPLSTRTAQPHLNKNDVAGIRVPYVEMRFQNKIVDVLRKTQKAVDNIDNRIGNCKLFRSNLIANILGCS